MVSLKSLASAAAPLTSWTTGGSIGGNSVLGLGLSMIPGVGAYLGQQETNAANARQAQAQMDFQERMSNTSYQRASADMKAAGLNPMLAYAQGGASAPNGAQAVMQNAAAELGKTVSSAMEALSLRKDFEQKDASIDLIKQQDRNAKWDELGKIEDLTVKTADALNAAHEQNGRDLTPGYYQNLAKAIDAQNIATAKAAKVNSIQSGYDEKMAIPDAILNRVGSVLGAVKSAKDVVTPSLNLEQVRDYNKLKYKIRKGKD